MDNNFITVIITAYNRKEFLLNAIKSVLNQTLDKKLYEIIVVKNFKDEIIDNFITKNNLKNIVMEGTIGQFLYTGIKESKGNIISFLDDDDLFLKSKLEYLNYIFSKNERVVYFHNRVLLINSEGKQLKNVLIRNPDFNISSITIRKEIINDDVLISTWTAPDTLLYILSLDSNKKIIDSNTKLNFYRIHIKNISSNLQWYNEYIEQIKKFYILFKNKKVRRLLKFHMLSVNIIVDLREKRRISFKRTIYYSIFLFINLNKSLMILVLKHKFAEYINHG